MEEQSNIPLSNGELTRKCIRELKAKYPNYSSAQIAKKIGMRQPTFNRIENGQIENPSLASISKLLSALGKSYKISEAVEKADPSLASTLKANLSHSLDIPVAVGDAAGYFADDNYRNIFLLAISRSGTTRDEVHGEYGDFGLKKLDEMVASGVLREEDGVVRFPHKNEVTFGQSLLKNALIGCTKERYDTEKFGTDENWLSFQTESVDKAKAMGLIRDKMQKLYEEIRDEILYSPRYHGNDKIFIGMVADSLLGGDRPKEPLREVEQ